MTRGSAAETSDPRFGRYRSLWSLDVTGLSASGDAVRQGPPKRGKSPPGYWKGGRLQFWPDGDDPSTINIDQRPAFIGYGRQVKRSEWATTWRQTA